MATIGLSINGDVKVHRKTGLDCLSIDLSKDLDCGVPYARDAVYLYGSPDDVRRLAQAILDAMHEPKEVGGDSDEVR